LAHQYRELNALHEKYALHDKYAENFAVLAFPCNQFGFQEPGQPREILNGIRYVRPGNDFQPTFDMFRKIKVNGNDQHPLFHYLKSQCPPTRDYFEQREKLMYNPVRTYDVRWNFEKFLIDRNGKPFKRYDPNTMVADIEEDVHTLLGYSDD